MRRLRRAIHAGCLALGTAVVRCLRRIRLRRNPTAITPPALRRPRGRSLSGGGPARDGISATVGLEVVVDESGHVVEPRVMSPRGPRVRRGPHGRAAPVRLFTFEPARRTGKAIRSTVQLSYEFHPPPPAHAARPTMDLPAPPARPVPPPAAPLQQGPDQSTLVIADRPRVTIGAPPERNAASQSSTDQAELALRPRYRAEGMLDVVPGLFSVQHAGGGKAQQDFARGFNLDHGTDMAFFVDDVPVNAVSHAHGQGYSDLHFLIPETVERVDSRMGPYSADVGDFGTAGSTSFRMADHTPESVAKLELAPSTGHARLVVVESPDLGHRWRMLVATPRLSRRTGPFIHPEGYDRFNGYAKVTRVLDERSDLSLMLMAYSGTWNMSGVLPARAGVRRRGRHAEAGAVRRLALPEPSWDSVDPTQGGQAQRLMVSAQYRRQLDEHWDLRASVYTLHSSLELFPNDGIAAPFQPDGIQYGSQIEQGRHAHPVGRRRPDHPPGRACGDAPADHARAAGARRRHRLEAALHAGSRAPRRGRRRRTSLGPSTTGTSTSPR